MAEENLSPLPILFPAFSSLILERKSSYSMPHYMKKMEAKPSQYTGKVLLPSFKRT
jgi:hypothetical protein